MNRESSSSDAPIPAGSIVQFYYAAFRADPAKGTFVCHLSFVICHFLSHSPYKMKPAAAPQPPVMHSTGAISSVKLLWCSEFAVRLRGPLCIHRAHEHNIGCAGDETFYRNGIPLCDLGLRSISQVTA